MRIDSFKKGRESLEKVVHSIRQHEGCTTKEGAEVLAERIVEFIATQGNNPTKVNELVARTEDLERENKKLRAEQGKDAAADKSAEGATVTLEDVSHKEGQEKSLSQITNTLTPTILQQFQER